MPTASSKSTPGPEAAPGVRQRQLPRLFQGELFLVTAPERSKLVARLAEIEAYLGRPQPARLHDLAFTVSRSYEPGLECVAIVASSHADLGAKLLHARERLADEGCARISHKDGIYYSRERLGSGKVALLFPGENAQYVNMLAELSLNFPEIRGAFDEADAACARTGDGFLPSALNFPAPHQSVSTNGAQPEISEWEKAVVLVHTANVAMGRLVKALKMRPDALLGHSFGELSALETAGVLRAGAGEDRARFGQHAYEHLKDLSHERDLPVGRLLAVGGADRAQIDGTLARFPDSLRLAMENCPHQYVLCASGPGMDEVIAEVEKSLAAEGAICSPLPIQRPYHTAFFEPAFALEKAYFEHVGVHPPQIEVYSCSTVERFPSDPEAIVEVAARHWMSCVRFQQTIETMYERGFRVFVDAGPRGNLCAFVANILGDKPHLTVALNRPQRSEIVQLLQALGTLAAHGVPMSVDHLHERWGSRVVELGETAKTGRGRKSMSVQLPVFLPAIKAEGITPSQPAKNSLSPSAPPPSPPAHAAAPLVAEPRPSPAAVARVQAPAAEPRDDVASVMVSYMETMEQFLAAQSEILGSLLDRGTGQGTAAALASPAAAKSRFPLLGKVVERTPGVSLLARRVFDVREDLYLNHHALGTSPSTTDPGLHALPIMPLLFSVEMAAEAAAALFPDLRFVAFVGTRAHHWIFVDRGEVTLRAVARRVEKPGDDVHVHVAIQQEDDGGDAARFPTMVETTVVLAAMDLAPPRSRIPSLPASAACGWTGSEIYPRRTFHGPLFQGIRSITHHSDEGLDGTIEVLPAAPLLASQPDAMLEIDPLLSDCLGQAAWLWGSKEPFGGFAYLPYGVDALRRYGPDLPPGTRLDMRLRVRKREPLGVVMDIEGVDSAGYVRLALEGLADREFSITPALHRLMLEPLGHYFAEVQSFDLSLPETGTRRVTLSTIADFPHAVLEGSLGVWRKALAFMVLSPPERQEWMELEATLRREIEWLLGRAAAKDALRGHFHEGGSRPFAPADVVIRTDAAGRPLVAGGWRTELPGTPSISISHTDGMVVAAAAGLEAGAGIGVDVEAVRTPSADLLDGAFGAAELALLPEGGAEAESQRSEWVFRAWCAKEAVGKALGSGVSLDPRRFALTRVDQKSGLVLVRPAGGDEVGALTMRRERHVLAVSVLRTAGSHSR